MQEVNKRPLYTESFESFYDFVPDSRSAYISGVTEESRSAHSPEWEERAKGVEFIPVIDQQAASVTVRQAGMDWVFPLRSRRSLIDFWARVSSQLVYLDYTGLPHHIWAPLIQSGLAAGKTIRAVYVEPAEYRRSDTPREGEIFDLSERITGIAPIPGFASLQEPREEFVFVPLLGFEGTRLAFLLEQVQPPGGKIIPVIGVPGFRPEYPFFTYIGNRPALSSTKAWRDVRFAKANCPFSLFYVLEEIAQRWQNHVIKIAPIGTKPHALGAVLFALAFGSIVELVYDHPIRKEKRTEGSDRVHVYHVSSLQLGRIL
jgi:hypothetical protein